MVAKQKPRRPSAAVHALDVAARIGNDDEELEADGVAFGTMQGIPGMVLPERVRKNATQEQLRMLSVAFRLVRAHIDLLQQLDQTVAELRRLGLSWETISWVTGLTAAGARKRWITDQDASS